MTGHHLTLYRTRRYGCWASCSCGWSGGRWTTVTGSHGEFGTHLIDTERKNRNMGIYYKAVRPDGFDFYTGTVDYASLCGTGESLPELPGGVCCTNFVYHASTSKADTLIGGSWPCRLFEVEGEPVSSEENKRGFTTLKVLRELPAWEALGPNGEAVSAHIDRCSSLTQDEIISLSSARSVAWNAALDAAWDAAREAAQRGAGTAAVAVSRTASRDAVWSAASTGGFAAWNAARVAARGAMALVVRDLISEEHFNALYGPWDSVVNRPS